jgi:RNA polymerase sigma-70 factor (ECF subfamily)
VNTIDVKIHYPLIEGCKKGDVRSQYKLYDLYSKAMYNLAVRLVGNAIEAEDIIQDAFTDCFAALKTFRYESTFGAWLKSIVVNRCINHLKKERKLPLAFSGSLPEVSESVEPDEPEYDCRMISMAIGKLPDGYRMVLTLYLLEGYDHEEIAGILDISESTSRSQYARAKEKLKELLKDEKRRR